MAWIGIIALLFHYLQQHKITRWLRWPSLIIGVVKAGAAGLALYIRTVTTSAPWTIEPSTTSKGETIWLTPEWLFILGSLGVVAYFLITIEQDKRKAAGK